MAAKSNGNVWTFTTHPHTPIMLPVPMVLNNFGDFWNLNAVKLYTCLGLFLSLKPLSSLPVSSQSSGSSAKSSLSNYSPYEKRARDRPIGGETPRTTVWMLLQPQLLFAKHKTAVSPCLRTEERCRGKGALLFWDQNQGSQFCTFSCCLNTILFAQTHTLCTQLILCILHTSNVRADNRQEMGFE